MKSSKSTTRTKTVFCGNKRTAVVADAASAQTDRTRKICCQPATRTNPTTTNETKRSDRREWMWCTHTQYGPSSRRLPPYPEGGGERGREGWQEERERARTNNVGRSRACGTFRSRSVAVVRRISRFGGRSVFCFVGCCWLPFVPPSIPRHEPHAVQSCFILLSLFFPVPLPSIRCDALRVGPFCSLRCRSFLFFFSLFFWGESRVPCRVRGRERGSRIPTLGRRSAIFCGPFTHGG